MKMIWRRWTKHYLSFTARCIQMKMNHSRPAHSRFVWKTNVAECRVTFKGGKGEISLVQNFPSPSHIMSEWLGREGGISPFQIYFMPAFTHSLSCVKFIVLWSKRQNFVPAVQHNGFPIPTAFETSTYLDKRTSGTVSDSWISCQCHNLRLCVIPDQWAMVVK